MHHCWNCFKTVYCNDKVVIQTLDIHEHAAQLQNVFLSHSLVLLIKKTLIVSFYCFHSENRLINECLISFSTYWVKFHQHFLIAFLSRSCFYTRLAQTSYPNYNTCWMTEVNFINEEKECWEIAFCMKTGMFTNKVNKNITWSGQCNYRFMLIKSLINASFIRRAWGPRYQRSEEIGLSEHKVSTL